MLVIGHIGWHREQDQQSDLATFSLFCGSLLVGLPLVIAVLIHRCRLVPEFSTLNELGMLTVGIVPGHRLCVQPATTITRQLAVGLLDQPADVHQHAGERVDGGYLAHHRGALFATGILLSIYRTVC